MRVIYDVIGDEEVIHDLRGMSARAVESRPILESIAGQLRRAELEHFETRGHGTWPPLAASTIRAKGHSTILVDSGDLKADLTEEGGVEEIIGDELVYGTTIFYARLHREGRGVPKRDPLVDLGAEGTMRAITKGVQAWIVGVDRAAFGVGAFGVASLDPFGLA